MYSYVYSRSVSLIRGLHVLLPWYGGEKMAGSSFNFVRVLFLKRFNNSFNGSVSMSAMRKRPFFLSKPFTRPTVVWNEAWNEGGGGGRVSKVLGCRQDRGCVLGVALRQAHPGDAVRPPLLARHDAGAQPVPQLGLLLALRRLRRLPHQPSAVHAALPDAVVRGSGRLDGTRSSHADRWLFFLSPLTWPLSSLPGLRVGQLQHPLAAAQPAAGRLQGAQGAAPDQGPADWPVQPRVLPQLHVRSRRLAGLHRHDAVHPRYGHVPSASSLPFPFFFWVGSVRFGLVWFGLVWFGLVWFGFTSPPLLLVSNSFSVAGYFV